MNLDLHIEKNGGPFQPLSMVTKKNIPELFLGWDPWLLEDLLNPGHGVLYVFNKCWTKSNELEKSSTRTQPHQIVWESHKRSSFSKMRFHQQIPPQEKLTVPVRPWKNAMLGRQDFTFYGPVSGGSSIRSWRLHQPPSPSVPPPYKFFAAALHDEVFESEKTAFKLLVD